MEMGERECFYVQGSTSNGMNIVISLLLDVVCDRMKVACWISENWGHKETFDVNPADRHDSVMA